ncbi:MAG: gamma-glutamyltransferase family protein [Nitrospinota bacterium]|nr:gamma-glutamyltransferase family protein [Nitrospinota bacterium]
MTLKSHYVGDTEEFELNNSGIPKPQRISASPRGMVSSAHYLATKAGVEMLKKGGNAVDAAVATAYALGVCEPHASGLGGQTMILIYNSKTGKTVALDGSSRAPHRIIPGTFSKSELITGFRASTVPSTPAVLEYVQKRYGELPHEYVFQPAISLAIDGYPISPLQHALTKREIKNLRKGSAGALFLRNGQKAYPAGHIFKQPELATALKRLSKHGSKTFYRGKIARSIANDMIKHGGFIRRDDLAQIPLPIERKPISTKFGAMRVITFPPPGAGRVLIEMLNLFSHLPAKFRDLDKPEGALALAEVIRQCNIDRNDRPRNPDFFPQVVQEKMLSVEYAEKVSKNIYKGIRTSGETTHLSVMDKNGNVVSLTQSIERVYGSCEISSEYGFLFNNYMSAFEYDDIGHPYYLRPNAVPWASVAPTIIFKGKRPWVSIGSPGSERIASSILQVLLRMENRSPLEAVSAPRMHCSIDKNVSLESSRIRDDVISALKKHGYTVIEKEPYSFYLGCVQMVLREGKNFIGVADPRRDGSACGPES